MGDGRGAGDNAIAQARVEDEPARLGEPEAFRAFYRAALPRVYGYFLHRCGGDAAVAEDLTQETFLAAVDAVRRGVAVAAPLPWVLGIARHKLIDHIRRQGRAAVVVPWDEAVERRAGRGQGPGTAGEEAARERAEAALAAVPPAQREALVLRYVDGLSVPEVAVMLGRSVHAVESLLARGRDGFRRRYREGDDGR